MQNATRLTVQLCKTDKIEIMQNNNIALTQKPELKNSYLKRTPDMKTDLKEPIRTTGKA